MKLILKYFDVAGRAEPLRVMLHAASSSKQGGFEWTDTRISFSDWPEEKKLAPLGCLPTLTGLVDDASVPPFCHTPALVRYFAKKASYYPQGDELEALVVDEALETLNELSSKIPFDGFVDEQDKKAKRESFQANEMKVYFTLVESRIQTFGEGKRLVKSGWTVADVNLWSFVQGVTTGALDYIDTNFFEGYPGITTTVKGIQEQSVMKAYHDHAEKAGGK